MTKTTSRRGKTLKAPISFLMLKSRQVGAGEFKARCLQLMNDVQRSGIEIVITKHRKPVARLVPARQGSTGFCGSLAGMMTKEKDLVRPVRVRWKADEPNLA
jgi:prevent-host-death family protein